MTAANQVAVQWKRRTTAWLLHWYRSPSNPVHDGTMLPPVVRFTKFDGYSYAAIRTPDGTWFTTQDPRRYGDQRIFPMTWADLLDWLGERNWSSLELLT
jgi:hypothetical protein